MLSNKEIFLLITYMIALVFLLNIYISYLLIKEKPNRFWISSTTQQILLIFSVLNKNPFVIVDTTRFNFYLIDTKPRKFYISLLPMKLILLLLLCYYVIIIVIIVMFFSLREL